MPLDPGVAVGVLVRNGLAGEVFEHLLVLAAAAFLTQEPGVVRVVALLKLPGIVVERVSFQMPVEEVAGDLDQFVEPVLAA